MKYKIGDKVKVKSDLKVGDFYGRFRVITDMTKFNELTIKDYSVSKSLYRVEENSYCWTEEMFNGLAKENENLKEKLKDGSIVELRNGDRFIKIGKTLLQVESGNYMSLNNYNNNLLFTKNWISSVKWDIVKFNNNVDNNNGYCNVPLFETMKYEKWTWIRQKKILDEIEKEYLTNIIRPFKKKILYITKRNYDEKRCYISIALFKDEYIDFPLFDKTSKMYKNMGLNKNYSLEDLNINL